MAKEIESNKLFIKDVFAMWYRIPEYQRPYVWDRDQVTELLDDITQAYTSNPDSQYFLGSMVLQKHSKIDQDGTAYDEYDVLDGQQRLTTLLLITAVIRDLTSKANTVRIDTCSKSIFQIANPDDNIPERLRIVFDIRDSVKDFVNEYVKVPEATLKTERLNTIIENAEEDVSVRNMSKAIITIIEYFRDNNIDDFFKYLRSNVLMIYVASRQLEDAFRLFQVLNSRGVRLRNSDILKADNLGYIENNSIRLDYAKKWEEIEMYFGDDFDNFLSHLRTILVKQKASVSLLKEFEDNVYNPKSYDRNTKTYTKKTPLLTKGIDTLKFIDRYYKHYERLFDTECFEITSSFEIHNQLHLMQRGFEADFWVAPLLKYYDKFHVNSLNLFIGALDNKFANDWLVGLTPTSRIENINAIIDAIDRANRPEDALLNVCLNLDNSDLSEALSGNIYGKRAARYVLLKLDLAYHGHTTKFSIPETISIEHILPQNPSAASAWTANFTQQDREEWTNRLGNLVVISRRKNSSQGNKDFIDKKETYFKGNIELFSNSIRIFNKYSSWTPRELMENHNAVVNKVKSVFDL
jgi:uncharacterized protein with ParB-like and HNH nuclease domain